MQKLKGKKVKTGPSPTVIKGVFIGNEGGFGFVVQEDTAAEDIFVPPSLTNGALHGDEVRCQLVVKKGETKPAKKGRRSPKALRHAPPPPETTQRQTGEIIEITHRKPLIGTYFTAGPEGYIRPMERKIPHIFSVPPKTRNRFGLADGHRVIFLAGKLKKSNTLSDKRKREKLDDSLWRDGAPHILPCAVTEVLGHIHDPGVDVLTLVRQYNIPYEFPEAVQSQAASLPDTIGPEDLQNRRDLRGWRIFTIDGDDTKDIDDAISLMQTPDGHYQLGVHIADVSHYVQAETPIDHEALERGTSVYLADRVIPMLPHRLSSGICSLFAGVDRLTVSCVMTVDAGGHVVSYEIFPSVINSCRRWTYGEVQTVLEAETCNNGQQTPVEAEPCAGVQPDSCVTISCASGQPTKDVTALSKQPATDWPPLFAVMNNLREVLYNKRHVRGALDFDLPEAKIKVDENGRPISIEPYQRNQATGIIEEFMILCNETIATHCQNHKIPLIYRAHDAPAPEKLAALNGLARSLGFNLPVLSGAKGIQRLLEAAEESPAYYTIAMAALTSLPQACYTPANPRHFGLASEAYCHFTSPIRRYADLQVHRIIKGWLISQESGTCHYVSGSLPFKSSSPDASEIIPIDTSFGHVSKNTLVDAPLKHNENLLEISAQCSRTEREAEALERDVAQLKKVQFMLDREGHVFEGIISGITPWGAYVMLPNTTEGLIPSQHLKRLGYSHDKDKNRYANKRSRLLLTMGAAVQVRLAHANEDERKLVFALQD